ncbi:P-selectin [Holothuria leucospilota]|uniref:p-selectin n=1 Tax=Holothuria leucospilota TaxID=206669 RepID=A0A9Q1CT96_HOLLE|nr:P-selectin [Holothuria leucospilota]
MKGFTGSYVCLITILFLILSPCDVDSLLMSRRRRASGYRSDTYEARIRRGTHPSEMDCELKSSPPVHGSVSCTDGNNHKSICDYTCDEGYKLSDPKMRFRVCDRQKWSGEEPTCEAIKSQ